MHVDLRQQYGRKGTTKVEIPQLAIYVCPEDEVQEGSKWYLCGFVGTQKNAPVGLIGHVDPDAVEAIRSAVADMESQTTDPVINSPPRRAKVTHEQE